MSNSYSYCILSEKTNIKVTHITLTERRICDNMTMLITFYLSKLLKMCHILPKATFFLPYLSLSMRFQCRNKKEHCLIRRKDEKTYF